LKFVLLCVVLLMSVIAQPCASADWPGFRGPATDGISAEKLVNTAWNTKPPKLVWKTDMSDQGYSGPSVVAGKVYIIDHVGQDDVVRCIDIKTGKDVWRATYPNPGDPNFGYTRATPAVSKGMVVTLSWRGLVACLDAKTGKWVWYRDTLKDFPGPLSGWGHGGSVLIDANKVIVCPGGKDSSVVALDLKTGKTIWQGGGSDPTAFATPVKARIQGVWQYVVVTASCFKGVDARDGKLLWQHGFATNANIATPIVIGNSVFVTASYNKGGVMLDIAPDFSVKPRWENKAIMAHFNTPVYLNGFIYGIGDPQNLVCQDAIDGSTKWIKEGFEKGPVMSVGGYLLALAGDTGQLALIKPDPKQYTELGRFTPLGGQSWVAPVFSGGYLLVRNLKELACFSVK